MARAELAAGGQAAQPAHPPRGAPQHGTWRDRAAHFLVDTYLALRVSTLGFTLLLPLAGTAAAGAPWSAARSAWLLAVALCFHAFAYVLNDVVDLDVDRTEPLRADSPLVRGALPRRAALALAIAAVPLAFALAWLGGLGVAAIGWLALAFGAMTVYDLWGKRFRWPLATDAVQAAGWCALLAFGGPAGAAPAALGWIGGYVFACVLVVQGVHGGVRDLANDARRGARTTALWLGARAREGDAVDVPPALVAYAAALQAAMVVCALGTWRALDAAHGVGAAALVAVLAELALACMALAVALRKRYDRRALVNAGAWHIVASLVVLPSLVTPLLPPAGAGLMWLAFALPVAAMWAYNGSHWHLGAPAAARRPSRMHALLRLMRVEKPLCATAFVFLGAWLAAPGGAFVSPRLLVAALAVFCITAFGFVVNDLCDVAVDTIGKPARPLPAGEVTPAAARTAALLLAAGGVLLSAALGPGPALFGAAATALSAAYSMRLKRTVLLGNACVALLVGAVLVFGAVVVAEPVPAVWIAAGITFSFIVAQEALFTLEDEHEDRAAGYRTTATVLGTARTARLVRALLLAFAGAALAPWVAGFAGGAYLVAMATCSIAPALVLWWWLRAPVAAARVSAAVRLSRLLWVTGFVPLALLK
jgi:geranylgeranylglycerol-phosphate geranylgeranyltransferase